MLESSRASGSDERARFASEHGQRVLLCTFGPCIHTSRLCNMALSGRNTGGAFIAA